MEMDAHVSGTVRFGNLFFALCLLSACGGSDLSGLRVLDCIPLGCPGGDPPAPPPDTSTKSELLVFGLNGSSEIWQSAGGRAVVLLVNETSSISPRSVGALSGSNFGSSLHVGGAEGATPEQYDVATFRLHLNSALDPPEPPFYTEPAEWFDFVTNPSLRVDELGGAREVYTVPVTHVQYIRESLSVETPISRDGTATITVRNTDGRLGTGFESATPVYGILEFENAEGFETNTFLIAGSWGDVWSGSLPSADTLGYSGFLEGFYQSSPGNTERVTGDVIVVVNFAEDTMSGLITDLRTTSENLRDVSLLPSEPIEENSPYSMRLPLFGVAVTEPAAAGQTGPEMSGEYGAVFHGPMSQYVHQEWDTPQLGGSVALTNGEASMVGGFVAAEN